MELLLKPDSVTGKKLFKGSLNMKTAIAIQQRQKQPVRTQLSPQLQKQQQVTRNSFLKIGGVGWGDRARQGNALRGHDNKEGNFHQL